MRATRMRRSIFLILVISFISLGTLNYFTLAAESSENTEGQIDYILISSKSLAHVNTVLRKRIETLFSNTKETYLEYNSLQASKYIQELDIKFVPFVVFDSSIASTEKFLYLVRNYEIDRVKGYYVIPDAQLKKSEIMLLERERQPNKLYIFVRGLSPFSKKTQTRVINFIRQNKLGISINLRYLVNIHGEAISSLNGPNEVKEDSRQIIIQKYYPDKFLDYLLLSQNKDAEVALKELSISLEDIDYKKDEALKMLKENFKEAKVLGIKRAPTFLWENVYLIPNLRLLKKHHPFNKKGSRAISKKPISGPIPIDFFHANNCHPCQKIKEDFLPKIKARFKDKIAITYHDISDTEVLKLKFSMEKEYGILGGSVPQIFLPTVVLEDAHVIRKNLVGAIEEILEQKDQPTTNKIIPGKNPILDKFSTFSPAVVTFAGLVDGINPCAFATMVFFVSFLTLNSYRKNQISYIGSAFIIGVFLTYLALGFGIFHAFKKLQIFSFFSQLIYYGIAFLALGLGIYSLCDYIQYKRTGISKGCSLKLYNRLRSIVDNRRGLVILIIGAFVNGFFIALLESACTGQVYFPTIAFVLKIPSLRLHAFLYLVLYNVAFILPLVGVFFLAYKGVTSEKVTLFTNKHLGVIKLATTFLFFSLAIFLFMF